MALLTTSSLSKSFGSDDIFLNISLSIPRRARIAIVGPNGIGKTTLLRILIGLEEPSSGSIAQARGISIGYLPQEADLRAAHSLWEECLSAFSDIRQQEIELARLESQMSDPARASEALSRYGALQHEFEHLGGYTYETRIRQALTGLGFSSEDYTRPLAQLSGGQRTRALLARLLLSNPDLLVLDEPTNHLDIQAVEWLEGYLATWEGAVLIVSHDRYFLDKVVDHIWEMSRSAMETYRGNYTAYLVQREERWQLRQQLFEAEKERLEKEIDYVKRNISGQRVSQAKGKLRRLSREVEAIESLGIEAVKGKSWLEISDEADISAHMMGVEEVERRIRGLRAPTSHHQHLKMHLKSEQRSGNIVLRGRDLVVGYPGEPLFSLAELELRRLEVAAIIGPNGAGKTTLLKTLLGQMPPLEGEVTLGAALQIGYFAQAHEGLRAERTLVEEIESVAPQFLLGQIRDYLARFLFTGDDVFRKVATLSGGERGRLALAKLALTQANLLLLDEPTNHLDIPSQEILQSVLSEYQGTILLVSHDRYLIDALASQIWEIIPGSRNLRVFRGSYSEYKAALEAERLATEATKQTSVERVKARQEARPSGDERKKRQRVQQLETEIARLEARLNEISTRLENPPSDPEAVQALGEDYVLIQDEINALLTEWESLHLAG